VGGVVRLRAAAFRGRRRVLASTPNPRSTGRRSNARRILLGDECVALGAVHAGVSSAYAYPGTPGTEILEYLLEYRRKHGRPFAAWCANEKTAMEEALGTCFAGRRALVSMKHVGLNVAADPFVNAALVGMHGGLVVAVADDPGMHSSQNEQDSASTPISRGSCAWSPPRSRRPTT